MRFRQFLTEHNIRQIDLANALEISRVHALHIWRGDKLPSFDLFTRIQRWANDVYSWDLNTQDMIDHHEAWKAEQPHIIVPPSAEATP